MKVGRIKGILYGIMLRLRSSGIGSKIYLLLDEMGVRIILSRIFNYVSTIIKSQEDKKQIQCSIEFYKTHIKEISTVCSILADEDSKETYKAMWRFRCTGNYRSLPRNSYRSQYFGNDYFDYKNGIEIFVDCGAFDGDTIRGFKRTMKKKGITGYQIVAFEPDVSNYENLLRNQPDVVAINAGCWDSKTTLNLLPSADGSSIQDGASHNAYIVDVVKLDDVDACHNATFIKMDIEGAEMRALEGARKLIKKNRPKLAICIYHSDYDMVRIPLLLHEMCPEYHMYVKQHSNNRYETVLYCVQ